jgi:hypothetical protein
MLKFMDQTPPTSEFVDLDAALEARAAALTDTGLLDRVLEIETARARLDAEEIHLLRALWLRGVLQHGGWQSEVSWLTRKARMSRSTASKKMRAARTLTDLPATAAALARAEISFEHVSAITERHRPETAALLIEHEPSLVATAVACRVDHLHTIMKDWDEATAKELGKESTPAHKDQYFHLTPTTGAWFGELKLVPEDGLVVDGALESICRELYAAAKRDREVDNTLDPYTLASEVRASALVEMARRAMAWDPARQRVREPALTVIIPLDDLNAGRGATTESGRWVPGETIKRLACSGTLQPVIVESLSNPQPLDLGRTQRLPSYSQRRAVAARDRHCRFPGCDLAASRCDDHHLTPWERGGATDCSNLALMCSRHHHLIHEGGWSISGNPNDPAGLSVRRPDGTPLIDGREPELANTA